MITQNPSMVPSFYHNKPQPNSKGFTFIELLITMIIISILSSVFIPNFLDLSKKRADLLVSELLSLTQAVQTYEAQTGDFPDIAHNCNGAIDILTEQFLIADVSTQTGKTPWGAQAKYITDCAVSLSPSQTLMTIAIETNAKWASYIANQLPLAFPNNGTTTLSIIKSAYIPVLDRFLYLDSTPTTLISSSGTYIAKGDIDASGFSIRNATITTRKNIDLKTLKTLGAITFPVADATQIIGLSFISSSINLTNRMLGTWYFYTNREPFYATLEAVERGNLRRRTLSFIVKVDDAGIALSNIESYTIDLNNPIATVTITPTYELESIIIIRQTP